jgi:hypothetical protein
VPLLRPQSFINTRDVDEGTDPLLDTDAAGAWLAEAEAGRDVQHQLQGGAREDHPSRLRL